MTSSERGRTLSPAHPQALATALGSLSSVALPSGRVLKQ